MSTEKIIIENTNCNLHEAQQKECKIMRINNSYIWYYESYFVGWLVFADVR